MIPLIGIAVLRVVHLIAFQKWKLVITNLTLNLAHLLPSSQDKMTRLSVRNCTRYKRGNLNMMFNHAAIAWNSLALSHLVPLSKHGWSGAQLDREMRNLVIVMAGWAGCRVYHETEMR